MNRSTSEANAVATGEVEGTVRDLSLDDKQMTTDSCAVNTEQHHGLLCSLYGVWQTMKGRSSGRQSKMASNASDLDSPGIQSAVEKLYSRVATDPNGKFEFHLGAEYAISKLGYDKAEIGALPKSSTQSFAGVANPHIIDPIHTGEVVLDIGPGSGTDLMLAARRVGPTGRAIGVEMTEEMIKRCTASIAAMGLNNVEIRRGNAESLPIDDASIDVVISNGVLNLVPDKALAVREVFRVLRPGGRFLFGDIVVSTTLLQKISRNVDLWALCVGGATTETGLVTLVAEAGFQRVKVTKHFDCVRGTSKEFFARFLGVRGVNIHALKPG